MVATEAKQNQSKSTLMVQVAEFSAELGSYAAAIGIYEDVARRSVENNLLKYSAKGYLLNAGICHLCGDPPCQSLAQQISRAHNSLPRSSLSLLALGRKTGNRSCACSFASEASNLRCCLLSAVASCVMHIVWNGTAWGLRRRSLLCSERCHDGPERSGTIRGP